VGPLIATVTLNPSIDRTLVLPRVRRGGLNYVVEAREDPSGKGVNVSLALQALGTPSLVFALVAGSAGERLGRVLTERGLQARLIRLPAGETRINTKVYEQEEGLLTELNELGPQATQEAVEDLRRALDGEVRAGDMVVFSGSLPPGCPADTYALLGRELRDRGVHVVIDTSGAALRESLAVPPFVMKPNLEEARELVGLPREAEPFEVARRLRRLWEEQAGRGACDALILTLGEAGAIFFTNEGTFQTMGPKERGTTAGCGDALLAAALWCRLQGKGWAETARVATAAAAAAAAVIGTRFPAYPEIERRLGQVVVTELELK